MNAVTSAQPQSRGRAADNAIWHLSVPELVKHIATHHPLEQRDLDIVANALRYISEEFYALRKSENVRGERINVTASPIDPEEGRSLIQLAVENGVKRSLEVGFSFGMSTCHLLTANLSSGGELHTAIDPFQLSEYYQGCGLKNVYKLNFGGRFRWINERSCIALLSLLDRGERFDLVFIDGSHIFGDVFIDAYYAYHLVPADGLMIFDDKSLAAVRTVGNIMRTNFGCANYSGCQAPDLEVLVKTDKNNLHWLTFATQFVPFQVAR